MDENSMWNKVLENAKHSLSSAELAVLHQLSNKYYQTKGDKLVISAVLYPVIEQVYYAMRSFYEEDLRKMDIRSRMGMDNELFETCRKRVLGSFGLNL